MECFLKLQTTRQGLGAAKHWCVVVSSLISMFVYRRVAPGLINLEVYFWLQSGVELVSQHTSSLRRYGVWSAKRRYVACFDLIRGADGSIRICDCEMYKTVYEVVSLKTAFWKQCDKRFV